MYALTAGEDAAVIYRLFDNDIDMRVVVVVAGGSLCGVDGGNDVIRQ